MMNDCFKASVIPACGVEASLYLLPSLRCSMCPYFLSVNKMHFLYCIVHRFASDIWLMIII